MRKSHDLPGPLVEIKESLSGNPKFVSVQKQFVAGMLSGWQRISVKIMCLTVDTDS